MASKTYVLTGVSNGIGQALASLLKMAGHVVIGLDIARPKDTIDNFIELDLNDQSSIETAVNRVPDAFDGLCNCAGLPPRHGLSEKILSVNFLGTRTLTNFLQPKLNNGASVVNLASRAGHGWREGVDQVKRLAMLDLNADIAQFIENEEISPVRAYDLSKEAIILWTMACSEEYLYRGQRINSISPGAVSTGILEDFKSAFGDRMTRNVQRAGRAGTAKEVAHLAAFLLAPESGWIKGADISIDGGMSAFNTSDALGLSNVL